MKSPIEEAARDLLAAEDVGAVLRVFRGFVDRLIKDAYVSLWYLDDAVARPCLLLADEFGSRFGGTVRPLHNRLELGVGLAGIAAQSQVVERRDLRDPAGLTAVVAPDLVEAEHILHLTGIPWPTQQGGPGGVVIVGQRTADQLAAATEELVREAAILATSTLGRVAEHASGVMLNKLTAEIGQSADEKANIATFLQLVVEGFPATAAFCLLQSAEGALDVVGIPGRSVVPAPVATESAGDHELDLGTRPLSVRLFRAGDPDELRENHVAPDLARRLGTLLGPSLDAQSHLVACTLRPQRDVSTKNIGLVVLCRGSEELGFLPEEAAGFATLTNQFALIVGLSRIEQSRRRVVSASGDVAADPTVDLALVTFFISAADIVAYERASILLEDAGGNWEYFVYDPRHSSGRGETTSIPAQSLPQTDESIIQLDRAKLALAKSSRVDVSGMLVPPPLHRDRSPRSNTYALPLQFRGELRGAAFITPSDSSSGLHEDQRQYLTLIGQQLAISANVDRLRQVEERFLGMVDEYGRAVSGSLLSISLSHETKNKLHVFAQDFQTVRAIARDKLVDPSADVLRRARQDLLSAAESGLAAIETIDALARIISDGLLSGDTDEDDGYVTQREPVYLNDIVRLYRPGLKLSAEGPGKDHRKSVVLSQLDAGLDRPKKGVGNPISFDVDDRVRIGQILTNLVLNALDATPRRGKVEVATRIHEADGELTAVLVVTDYGVGMSDEIKARIFEPFFSRRQGGKRGFGLGMLIVRTLVNELGGDLDFESAPNRGTRFQVSLPLGSPSKSSPTARRG